MFTFVLVAALFACHQRANAQPLPDPRAEAIAEPTAAPEPEPSSESLPQEPPTSEATSTPAVEPTEEPVAELVASTEPATILPGKANGVEVPDHRSGQLWRWPLRGILFVPRLAIEVLDAPIRGSIWLYEAYDLGPRTRKIFFNEDGTIGMFPLAFLETGFGLNVGLRFVHRDLFGKQEKLNLRASFGGRYQQLYNAKISSEERWPFNVSARGELEVRPKDVYYGIGQELDAEESRFSQLVGRVLVSTKFALGRSLSLEVGGSYTYRDFDSDVVLDDAASITTVYPDDSPVGFDEGVSALNSLVRLNLDTRRSPSRYESAATPSIGWLVSGFASTAHSVDNGPTKYLRVGADIQVYQRILEGPRAIAVRVNYDQVHGEREEIPFTDLPRLGGPVIGRGFQQDRFRDKAALLFSAEYQWSLNHLVLAAVFVDYGRVAPKARALLSEFDDFALGGGVALQAHSAKSFLVRASLAGSEQGLFFNVSFDPQFGPTNILEQK